ncbi:MAG: UTP--glucose-1-phosphate uridylyltransferase [Methylococcus sp.]|jgi:UTP--glucose-1-phosphate uridylyltransferase|nr:MAG: UTP--glucose-1-phosphate uridylyltransferase [Methylococcus sp.]
MHKKVTKAVFPVAGLGTRFLPATKSIPKEMLPIVDKPLIQYAVEEAIAAGIETLIFITGRTKGAIADHFDKSYELEKELEQRQKTEALDCLNKIVPASVSCVYLRQAEALGLGHAVLCAKPVIEDEPFAVVLPDDLVHNEGVGCLGQMTELFDETQSTILGVERVPPELTASYGIVKTASDSGRLNRIDQIVEKPQPKDASSNLGVVGRYILAPTIFGELQSTDKGAGGEIQLTDAIAGLMSREAVYAYEFHGTRYDCGTKLGFLTANVEYALRDAELKQGFRGFLSALDIHE